MNEQSNAHEWESAGTNEQIQARALACTHARMHAQTDQWLLRYSTSK